MQQVEASSTMGTPRGVVQISLGVTSNHILARRAPYAGVRALRMPYARVPPQVHPSGHFSKYVYYLRSRPKNTNASYGVFRIRFRHPIC